jgi:hypothetical protein
MWLGASLIALASAAAVHRYVLSGPWPSVPETVQDAFKIHTLEPGFENVLHEFKANFFKGEEVGSGLVVYGGFHRAGSAGSDLEAAGFVRPVVE